jgi:hypothetical protein
MRSAHDINQEVNPTPEELETFTDEALIMYALYNLTPTWHETDRGAVVKNELARRLEVMPRVKVPGSLWANYDKLPEEYKLTQDEILSIAENRIIDAVRSLRGRTGLRLKEAKDIVDLYRAREEAR